MIESPQVNSRIGRVTHWRSLSERPGSQVPQVCFFGGRPLGGTETRRAFAAANEAENQVPPGAGFDSKRVPGQARKKPGRQSHFAKRRRSVAEQNDTSRRHAAETSSRHDEKEPAKSATRVEPLCSVGHCSEAVRGALTAGFESHKGT